MDVSTPAAAAAENGRRSWTTAVGAYRRPARRPARSRDVDKRTFSAGERTVEYHVVCAAWTSDRCALSLRAVRLLRLRRLALAG